MKALAVLKAAIALACDLAALVVLPIIAAVARFRPKPIDVGLGPWPSIASVHQKRSMVGVGYSVETFVFSGERSVSDFDYIGENHIVRPFGILLPYLVFIRAIWRYKIVYLYFSGGPLGKKPLCQFVEPLLFKMARTKIAAMPFGSDVQEMSRSSNLLFKHFNALYNRDNRKRRTETGRRIDRWTRWADHVISGVEWVDYMYHWDTLTLTPFGVDLEKWSCVAETPWTRGERTDFVILHAPNHPLLKGTHYFEQAVRELRDEGLPVTLRIVQRMTNDEVRREIAAADAVADQLVIGWYAMFAMEAMASGRPVFCYLRQDLIDFYVDAGLLKRADLPIVNCGPQTVKMAIRALVEDRAQWRKLAERSRAYVEEYHSTDVMAVVFTRINTALGVVPAKAAA